jgi:hypothetical protein
MLDIIIAGHHSRHPSILAAAQSSISDSDVSGHITTLRTRTDPTLTHAKAWQLAATSGAPLVCVLEDDVVVGRHFQHNIMEAFSHFDDPDECLLAVFRPAIADDYDAFKLPGVHTVMPSHLWWGAQALVATPVLASMIASLLLFQAETVPWHPDARVRGRSCHDTYLYDHLPHLGIRTLLHTPTLTEHLPGPSLAGAIGQSNDSRHAGAHFIIDWRA